MAHFSWKKEVGLSFAIFMDTNAGNAYDIQEHD